MSFLKARDAAIPTSQLDAPGYAGADPNAYADAQPTGNISNVMQGVDPNAPAMPRRSVLSTIGQISDVLARVGGAQALYQPTLDARLDRTNALGDHTRQVDLDKLKIETAQGAVGDANNTRLGQAIRGLQAIRAANPQADVSKIWPVLAQQAGVDPARAAALAQHIQENPELLQGLADAAGNTKEFGLAPFYAKDQQGNLQAYQISKDGSVQAVALPDGSTPVDPLKFIDTGNAMVGVGSRTGNPTRILPKMEKPGAAADRTQRDRIATNRNATAVEIAGMRAGGQSGAKADDVQAERAHALTLLSNIENGFNDLHRMQALPGDPGSGITGALGRTHLGQILGEQAGSLPAQKRLEIAKNVSALQQAMLKSLPASATRTKFEQEMLARGLPDPSKMSLSTARTVIQQLRDSYARAVQGAATSGAPAAGNRVVPRTGQPSVSNW